MTSLQDGDIIKDEKQPHREPADLPPSGTSLHKRRRGEHPVNLAVKPQTSSDAEGSSPFTPAYTPNEYFSHEEPSPDPIALCDSMIQRLKDQNDPLSQHGREIAVKTKDTMEAMDQLEKLLRLLDQFLNLKQEENRLCRRLRDVDMLKRLHESRKKLKEENEKLRTEERELHMFNEAFDSEACLEEKQAILDHILSGGRLMKRSSSKWKSHSRFGGSLLRKQRSRSAGAGEESDAPPLTPVRRRSEAITSRAVDKSKVSKWTRVKTAFRWEKAQWTTSAIPSAGAVAAGALVSAVALAGSSPSSAPATLTYEAPRTPGHEGPRSLATEGPSTLSLEGPSRDSTPTPNSSCEELRMALASRRKSGILRSDENDNTFLHAPMHDDSSTSPSPNKMHKSPWGKMRDIIQTRRESVRKKTSRTKVSPDVIPLRRRSMSDGGDSDAPPALTLTIPSSEELESEPPHPVLRKQRSLELSARPPQRLSRASKWSKVKRAFLTSASASVPSSPSRHSAFFTDNETEGLSSGCEASGVKDEIARDYAALQSRLGREFSDRMPSRPVATEEQLSPDFRKKLAEWQRMKGVRQPPPVPARQDLSEEFLKKWDAWKHMKETNSVPAWAEEAKRDEVFVKTSTGLFKFQGISRSFTRKLHEWEKSRGIAPEASTSALLRAAKAKNAQLPAAPLTRTQSDGSVAPSIAGSGRLHASSLSVNDADNFDLEFGDGQSMEGGEDTCDGDDTRGAVLVEFEDEEVCTAAPLMAVSPRHQPQKPIYTYGHAEARLLCETSSAVTGTAILQPNGAGSREGKQKGKTGTKGKARQQIKSEEPSNSKRKLGRQPSIEEDAKFIRKTIDEIERGSANRYKDNIDDKTITEQLIEVSHALVRDMPSTSKAMDSTEKENQEEALTKQDSIEEPSNGKDDGKRKDGDKTNGKKKSKSRARLEREQSKPSESDTEADVDTITVEIPRRRKRPRRPSERPKTPSTSLHSEFEEEEVYVLKIKAPEPREGSPEVLVRTTRKIFSPVVRCGETVPSAVIPVDVEYLAEVKPMVEPAHRYGAKQKSEKKTQKKKEETNTRSKSSGDLQEGDEHKTRNRPPLPLSPSSQRKPQAKETAPSIRIMIQRYNMKINEEVQTSGASSGASSPAWRSPASERRRPPDMPVGVNIRNNPFLEREVQKSASACQLSRRDQTSAEKPLELNPPPGVDGVLKSHSANALHPDSNELGIPLKDTADSQDTINHMTASTDTIVPDLTRNLPVFSNPVSADIKSVPYVLRESSSSIPTMSKKPESPNFDRSVSVAESSSSSYDAEAAARVSARAARIKEARERFLSSPSSMRREGTSSASDLRPGDRSSRISCDSDIVEAQSTRTTYEESSLGRSASTGMVNVDRESWERVAEDDRRQRGPTRSRFSLARLAAKLRRKDESSGVVSKLCRQSLLVQIRNKQ